MLDRGNQKCNLTSYQIFIHAGYGYDVSITLWAAKNMIINITGLSSHGVINKRIICVSSKSLLSRHTSYSASVVCYTAILCFLFQKAIAKLYILFLSILTKYHYVYVLLLSLWKILQAKKREFCMGRIMSVSMFQVLKHSKFVLRNHNFTKWNNQAFQGLVQNSASCQESQWEIL